MPDTEFIAASASTHRAELIALNVEYMSWVFAGVQARFGIPADEIVGIPPSEYVPGVIDRICGDPPPKGVFCRILRIGRKCGATACPGNRYALQSPQGDPLENTRRPAR